jgi:hypothetical protein
MDMPEGRMKASAAPAGATVLAAFTAAIFTSAFLLFSIQPMFTKMVLPQLGGSPAVWSIAMVVFQALLLAGYGYAHLSTTRLSTRNSALLHIALLIFTLIALPIGVTAAMGEAPVEGQAGWLIGVFLISVGLPFFAVAGNGPLLQAWFARSGHKQAHDPYFLYGASNLGSFAALLLYPVLFEPLLRLQSQSLAWSLGFGVLMVLIALSAYLIQHAAARHDAAMALPANDNIAEQAPGWGRIAGWITLSFIPSGLLVAVTAHISTDVAAAPFLWVVPLALFLLTFVLIFRDKPLVPMVAMERLLPLLATSLVLFAYLGAHMFVMALVLNIAFFFVATLVCHDQLYRQRPSARYLTHFYLWMSFGGVLGGLFCGLLAPAIFNRVLEYPILAVMAVAALPQAWQASRADWLKQGGPILLIGALALIVLHLNFGGERELSGTAVSIFLVAAAFSMLFYRRPIMVVASLIALFAVFDAFGHMQGGRIYERSFFGVHKVDRRNNGEFRVLSHGTTIHGAMRIRNADGTPFTGRPKPLTYYHPDGPIAETLNAVPHRNGGRRLGVIGLGAGAHACNGGDGDRWTFFEIDPLVVKIATDPTQFRFLSTCAPSARLILGDARLTLAREPHHAFDNLLVDAFSSDSIPVHLMTKEALALYVDRLAPGGILTMHISNRHMELASVVASLARELGLVAKVKNYHPPDGVWDFDRAVSTSVVVLARDVAHLGGLDAPAGWTSIPDRKTPVWTDDFSNIVTALWRHYSALLAHRWQGWMEKSGS